MEMKNPGSATMSAIAMPSAMFLFSYCRVNKVFRYKFKINANVRI